MARLEVAEMALADAQARITTLEAERDELRQKVEDAEWAFFEASKVWKRSTSRVVFWDDIRAAREAT